MDAASFSELLESIRAAPITPCLFAKWRRTDTRIMRKKLRRARGASGTRGVSLARRRVGGHTCL